MVSSDLVCTLSSHFVFLLCPIIWQSSKIAFFKKRAQKLGFSIFSVLSLDFENSLFLGLLKHYKNRGFGNFWCFLLLKEKKTSKKNDNWNFRILVFLVQKWPFRDAYVYFKKKVCWNTYFYSVLGCALFGPSCQEKGNFGHPPKKEETFDW